ncbi:DNA-binding response regulator [Romboutsia ilealis]|uniref:Stage 0 sporulation protein A homolog n=1 Tax=Romboutsia faecis TaxID=2764597 RepID=A0ABR7JLX4_9FIRM|nr:LytTR family DNA-binding domain-containing protein [Romboutsia faecis]MBC5995934.1 response regulator transcription factor [Romboutsia faecis]MRN23134.1 DNA-binding response regulator [Romboutsia ilealis]
MKSIIVEDEFPAREELKYFINNFSNIDILAEFDNGLDVLKFIQNNFVDVIFLDINIPQFDGMLLAKTISQFKDKPKIVFITAYKEHAVDAFELDAFDYVLKPYSDDRIKATLKKLEKAEIKNDEIININTTTLGNLTLWKDNKLVVVNIEEIYYCEARERETLVYTKDGQYIYKNSMVEFEKKLTSEKFFKTHRSYIVNVNKIKEIIPWFNSTYKLKLNGIENDIYVSRSKIKEFKKLMNI